MFVRIKFLIRIYLNIRQYEICDPNIYSFNCEASGKAANQDTPGSTSSEKERPGWGGLLPWPLIQWWRWPSGLTHPGGLPWPAVAACSVLRPPRPHFHPGLLLPSLPPPPLLGKGRCFNEGGKEVFWQFRLFLSRRFVSQTQYSFSIPNSTLLIPSTVESGL